MEKNKISEDDKKEILQEIKELRPEKPYYLLGLFANAQGLEFPEEFIAECKKAISKNKAFKDTGVIDYLSGLELSDLFDLCSEY